MIKTGIGTRQEWLAEQLDLLDTEKELTRRSNEPALRRNRAAARDVAGVRDLQPGVNCSFCLHRHRVVENPGFGVIYLSLSAWK